MCDMLNIIIITLFYFLQDTQDMRIDCGIQAGILTLIMTSFADQQ